MQKVIFMKKQLLWYFILSNRFDLMTFQTNTWANWPANFQMSNIEFITVHGHNEDLIAR